MLSVHSMAGLGSIWEWTKATILLRSIVRDFKQWKQGIFYMLVAGCILA